MSQRDEANPYDEPHQAAVYDTDNPDGPDHDFFRRLVAERDARSVTDLGCGTGILTVTLVAPGRSVVGIDPAAAMLDVARSRPGGDTVEWRLGGSELVEPASSDVVLMTGNVAMHLVGDVWHRALHDIAAGLRPGGALAFETRNPLAEQWREWDFDPSEDMTPVGRRIAALTTDPPDAEGVVTMHSHDEFPDEGVVLDRPMRLQFRGLDQVTSDLAAAGLRVERVSRDWSRTPFTNTAQERLMVVEAVRP